MRIFISASRRKTSFCVLPTILGLGIGCGAGTGKIQPEARTAATPGMSSVARTSPTETQTVATPATPTAAARSGAEETRRIQVGPLEQCNLWPDHEVGASSIVGCEGLSLLVTTPPVDYSADVARALLAESDAELRTALTDATVRTEPLTGPPDQAQQRTYVRRSDGREVFSVHAIGRAANRETRDIWCFMENGGQVEACTQRAEQLMRVDSIAAFPFSPAQLRSAPEEGRPSASAEEIRGTIRAHIGEVRTCYERTLDVNPNAQGQVVVEFALSPFGLVQASWIARSSMNNPALESCIVNALETWVFPAHAFGVRVINYPFTLETD